MDELLEVQSVVKPRKFSALYARYNETSTIGSTADSAKLMHALL